MRFENDGMVLWYGTLDAPAPDGAIRSDAGALQAVTITVAVQPPSASNSVTVRYRVNGGAVQTVVGGFLHHDVAKKAQYFSAQLRLQAGDQVDYTAVGRCPGRQVPAVAAAEQLASSFRVIKAATHAQETVPAQPDARATLVAPDSRTLRTTAPERPAASQPTATSDASSAAATWTAMRAHPAFARPGAVARAQFALQLDAVTNGHAPLVQALQQKHGITSMRGLLDLDPSKLRATIDRPDVGVPASIPGESAAARADAYVAGINTHVQLAFPTETATKVLGRAAPSVIGDDAVKTGVLAALSRATSDTMRAAGTAFDIGTTHIDDYIAAHGDVVLADVAEPARGNVVSALKRTQRLFRVSTGADSLDWLHTHGYNSRLRSPLCLGRRSSGKREQCSAKRRRP